MSSPRPPLANWTPFRIRAGKSEHRVDWCYVGTEAFTDPFFEQTLARCLKKPFNQFVAHETPIDNLLDWSPPEHSIAPTAFIFHGSRCGSTLLARMAAALPGTVVLSEAATVDHVLRARVPQDTRIEWLRALLNVLGQPRRDRERRLVVKFDASHVLELALVQRAFPGVPCIFLYREPAAVIASQLRSPGVHMVPGMLDMASIGMSLPDILRLDGDEYAGRVLGAFYAAAASHAALGRVTLMNYAQFPEAGMSQVLAWFGLANSAEARRRVEHACGSDAKSPSMPYNAADVHTRPLPSQRTRDVVAQFVAPIYAQLESIRTTTGGQVAPSSAG